MDTLGCLILLLPLACLDSAVLCPPSYGVGVTLPESPYVWIGKNFTAVCVLSGAATGTADDIIWMNSNIQVPKEQYTQINDSIGSVTITVSKDTKDWLFCKSRRQDCYYHGIALTKGYPPEKPKNLSCMAVQSGSDLISSFLTCTWEPGTTHHTEKKMIPEYTLSVEISSDPLPVRNKSQWNNTGMVDLGTYPHHMVLNIWVEAENGLGKETSDYLEIDANDLVKTDPPLAVGLIAEKEFPTSLRVEWKHPIHETKLKLKYNIRFCVAASGTWIEVPQRDTVNYMESFRLQDLKPDTEYVVQVRCINHDGAGYWSDWSPSTPNTTARTPEAKPTSKPDLWRVINHVEGKRKVQVLFKAPVESNGKIRMYNVTLKRDRAWETVPVTEGRKVTVFREIDLPVYIQVIARNDAGVSPKASLFIPKITQDLPRVESLRTYNQEGKLWLEWTPAPNVTALPDGPQQHHVHLAEYVVEWVSSDGMDWQREGRHSRGAFIRGNLDKWKRYNISVYPVYTSGLIGNPTTTAAFLEEGGPLEGVTLKLKRPGKHGADLEWSKIPLDKQCGFITHYTVYYSTLDKTHKIEVSPDTYSYTLTSLASHTRVVALVGASTIKGEKNSTKLAFITAKYAPGQVEGIVVGVCFGFLFAVVLTVFFCLYKKKWIKKIIWPDVPDPSNSTIATWSPDFPSKADTPKESALADVSVVEVDVFDGKSLFEEDKVCLPLKKDKYLSEEHSSGIGGSSCMSSPRQSVSDSDEGGDSSGQTTASTVQYSSVVAASSSGYKGQTPGPPPQGQTQTQQTPAFARSESTQPLLDSEEHPETPGLEGHAPRYPPRNPYFRRSAGAADDDASAFQEAEFSQMEEEPGGFALLRFSPLEEGSQQTTPTEEAGRSPDGQPAGSASSGYRPQLSGYRPQ